MGHEVDQSIYKRDFKGIWLPKAIWFNKDLTIYEKHLLMEIDSLDAENGCFAGNDYLGKFMGMNKESISRMISKLKKSGFIYEESFNGRKRVLRSNIKADLTIDQVSYASKVKHSNKDSNKVKSTSKEVLDTTSVVASQLKKWKDCLELLHQELRLRLPKVEEDLFELNQKIPVKKNIDLILMYLEDLLAGEFLRTIGYKGDMVLKPMTVEQLFNFLKKVIGIYKNAIDPNYWPMKKGWLSKKMYAVDFFRHPKEGNSALMWMLENEKYIIPLKQRADEEIESGMDTELLDRFRRIVNQNDIVFEIKQVLEKARNILTLPGIDKLPNYEHFSTPNQIVSQFADFLSNWDGATKGNLLSAPTWTAFENMMWDQYDFDMSMSRPEAHLIIDNVKKDRDTQKEKEEHETAWASGDLIYRRMIYQGLIATQSMVTGNAEKAEIAWDLCKGAWIDQYGDCEWIDETYTDGVIDKGGEISDRKGLQILLGKEVDDAKSTFRKKSQKG